MLSSGFTSLLMQMKCSITLSLNRSNLSCFSDVVIYKPVPQDHFQLCHLQLCLLCFASDIILKPLFLYKLSLSLMPLCFCYKSPQHSSPPTPPCLNARLHLSHKLSSVLDGSPQVFQLIQLYYLCSSLLCYVLLSFTHVFYLASVTCNPFLFTAYLHLSKFSLASSQLSLQITVLSVNIVVYRDFR